MKRVFLLSALLLAFTAPAFAAVVNGDWGTGDETGWTRWAAPWGGSNYAITNNGPTPPEGNAFITAGQTASFGWYQVIACPVGWVCTVNADWAGDIGGAGWAEVMFWTEAAVGGEGNHADTGNAADVAFKKDSWGMNPPTAWSWQPANLSPHPSGNNGTVVSQGYVVVAFKLGSVSGNPAWTSWDNITVTCVPEPGSLLALGSGLIGLAGVARRRK